MNIQAENQRVSFFDEPRKIAWVIILITLAWAILQWALSAFVFLAIVIVFVTGLKKPIWALAALLFQQFTVTSYMIPTPFVDLSLRLVMILLTLFVLRGALARKEIDLGPHVKQFVIPAIILIIVTVLANSIDGIGFDALFRDFRNIASGLLFAILLPAIIENTKQLKIILIFCLVLAGASSVVSILQHYNVLGMAQATLLPNFMSVLKRSPGMSEMELELSYMLSVTLIIIVGISVGKGLANKKLLALSAAPMLLGLWFTYTRSAFFALVCGLVSVWVFFRLRRHWWTILVILLIALVFLANSSVIAGAGVGGRSSIEQQESSVARAVLWQAGVAMISDNPLWGIGSGQFMGLSVQYTSRVDPALINWEANRYWSYRTLGNDPPHNDYLMMWVSYGVFALIMFLWLHFVLLHNFKRAFNKSHDRFLKGLSLGLAAGLITYVANSFYHNLLDTMPLFWVLAGFSLVTMKLAAKEEKTEALPESLPVTSPKLTT
jgi:O-antigen ligase